MNAAGLQEIIDPRLTPDLQRIRNGSSQGFRKPGRRDFNYDFEIPAPHKHYYAELIDGKWYWVNGCDECHGREGSWTTYIKCETHDVCCACGTSRKNLTEIPWGHPKGFMCKPCHSSRREAEKVEALRKNARKEYCQWDYDDLDDPTCPFCDLKYEEPNHGLYEADCKDVKCERCDNTFEVTAHQIFKFSSKRPD